MCKCRMKVAHDSSYGMLRCVDWHIVSYVAEECSVFIISVK